jgi:molecular chaperone GrpE
MTANKAPYDAGSEADASEPGLPSPSVEDLASELAATKDRLARALIDQEDARAQARSDRDEAVRYAAADFTRDLLSSIDYLEQAIASVPESKLGDAAVANLMAAVDATRRALLDTFCRHGLKRLEPLGERFDPHMHEASFKTADLRHPHGAVTTVVHPGYLHLGHLLRPARVVVNRLSGSPPRDQTVAETNEMPAPNTAPAQADQ